MSNPKGRPKLDKTKAKMLGVRLEESEKTLVEQAAKLAGKTPGAWAREILLEKARAGVIV